MPALSAMEPVPGWSGGWHRCPWTYSVCCAGSDGCTAVGHPLRLLLSGVISSIAKQGGAQDSDLYLPFLLRPHQATAHDYCHAVLLSIIMQCAAAVRVGSIGSSLAAKHWLWTWRVAVMRWSGGQNRCEKSRRGEKMHYSRVGFTLKVFSFVPVVVENTCSVAAEQKAFI